MITNKLAGPATVYPDRTGADSPQRGWFIVPPAALLKFNIRAVRHYGRQPNLTGMRFPAVPKSRPGVVSAPLGQPYSVYTQADGYMNLRAPRPTWNGLAPGFRPPARPVNDRE